MARRPKNNEELLSDLFNGARLLREYWIDHSQLTIDDVAEFLGVDEDDAASLAEEGRLRLADDGTCTILELNECARNRRESDAWDLKAWNSMRPELREKIDPTISWRMACRIAATPGGRPTLSGYARTWNVHLDSSTSGVPRLRLSGLAIIWSNLLELRLRNLSTGAKRLRAEPVYPGISLERENLSKLSIQGIGSLTRECRGE